MRRLFHFLALSAIAAILMLPALAQTPPAQAHSTPQAIQSQEEANSALYQKFLDTYQNDQPTAYHVAKEYLRTHPQETEQTRYLLGWVNKYAAAEKAAREWRVKRLIEEKRFDEAFARGRDILASEPDNIDMLYTLIDGGLFALACGNKALTEDSSNYSRQALQLLESGRAVDEHKERRLGWLNFTLGIFSLTSAPAESALSFYRAMQFEAFKRDAFTYSLLADAILGAQYYPLQKEYSSRFPTPEQRETEQAKPIRLKLNLVADHVIYVLARAIALAGSDERFAQLKVMWMQTLTNIYKFRNDGYVTGLSEYIEEVLDKPLPAKLLQY